MHVLQNGVCVTCTPVVAARSVEHVLVDGVCTTCPARTVARYDPTEPRDPHSGKWIDGPGGTAAGAAKVLGQMTADAFFAAHGNDWEDQYGSGDTLQAILWANGDASLYRDLPKGKVQVFADIDSGDARRLADGVHWAVDRSESGAPAKVAEQRTVDLGGNTAQVGYGYDQSGDLFVQVVMPGEKTPIDMVDLDQVSSLVDDLRLLADDLDS